MSRAANILGQKREDLSEALRSLLRETAFDNRYVLHPRRLTELGGEVTESFIRFTATSDVASASVSGALLAREGLGEKTILKLAEQLRIFCRRELTSDVSASGTLFDCAESFATSLIEGFMRARETQILTDQEQLRRALTTALASQSQELLVKNHAINTSINGIMLADLDGKVMWVNSSFLRMWGFASAEQVLGMSFEDLWDAVEGGQILEALPKTTGWHGQLSAKRVDGNTFSVELSVSLIKNEEDKAIGMMSSVIDITEHLKAEEMAKNLLLVKEIHHRIKNNLQVISSLLYLQSEYVQEERTRDMFRESQNRVHSMALLHEKLYKSRSLAGVDFLEYIKDLTRNLLISYGVTSPSVGLTVNAEGITLGMDTAVPCGLIINELVSNSLKHAFAPDSIGEIRIEILPSEGPRGGHAFEDGKWYQLTVSDNGKGFPEGLDFRKTESLGLNLVCTLTRQLSGTIELDRRGGSRFTIVFREA